MAHPSSTFRSPPPNEKPDPLPTETPTRLEQTACLLCGDLTVEPKGGYDYEWYVGSRRVRAAAHAGGYFLSRN